MITTLKYSQIKSIMTCLKTDNEIVYNRLLQKCLDSIDPNCENDALNWQDYIGDIIYAISNNESGDTCEWAVISSERELTNSDYRAVLAAMTKS